LRCFSTIIEQDAPEQLNMEFIEEHPIIRGMSDYQDFVGHYQE
jgi:hypothetical protein